MKAYQDMAAAGLYARAMDKKGFISNQDMVAAGLYARANKQKYAK